MAAGIVFSFGGTIMYWGARSAVVAAAAMILPFALEARQSSSDPILEQHDRAEDRYSVTDTEIGALIDDPRAKAVVEKYVPGIFDSPQTKLVRGQTLKSIQGYGVGVLTDELLAKIDRELASLGPVTRSVSEPAGRLRMTTDEAKVRSYILPDPLTLSDGSKVTNAAIWWTRRRPEILAMFSELAYGRAPSRPSDLRFNVFDKGTPAFGGKAVRRQVTIHVSKDPAAPTLQLVEYIPAKASKPVPMLLVIGFSSPAMMFDDPGIRASTVWDQATRSKVEPGPSALTRIDAQKFLDAGFGVTAFYYADLEPDFPGGYSLGIRAAMDDVAEDRRAANAWGATAAWAWSLSRVQDYLETDPAVDARRVAIFGASRLGKTVLWAGAADQRFAAVIACCSGKLGAGLIRRNYGASVTGADAKEFDYSVAPNFRRFFDNEDALPMDGHMLLSLLAPRPVLLQTGKLDHAADPKGEFLGAVAAGPVYRMLGAQDLGTTNWPPTGPILNTLGYHMHSGGHGPATGDWDIFLDFLQRNLKVAPRR